MNQTRTKRPTISLWEFPRIWMKTITDIRMYRSLVHVALWVGLLYTFLTYGVLAIGKAAVFQMRTIPQWKNTALSSWQELHRNWPENMVVQYQNSTLTLEGVEQPLTIPYPEIIAQPEDLPRALAFVDTTVSATAPDSDPFAALETPVLFGLTQDSIVIQPARSMSITDTNSTPWSDFFGDQNFTIQKSDLDQRNAAIETALPQAIQATLLPYFFMAWWGLWLARLAILGLYALFGQLLFWMFGTKIRYGAAFRLGLYTLPVIELVFVTWQALYGTILWPGSFWWIWMAFMAFLAWYNRKGQLLIL